MDKKLLVRLVKPEYIETPLNKLLLLSTDALIDISKNQAMALEELKIMNVNDLGLSAIFLNARFINSISNKGIPSVKDILPEEIVVINNFTDSLDNLKFGGIELLTGVGESNGKILEKFFGFKAIRDLAKWKPFIAARLLVNSYLGLESSNTNLLDDYFKIEKSSSSRNNTNGIDPEAPQDLVPKTGEYPVEVIYYDSVLMIESPKRKEMKEITGRVKLSFDDTKIGYDTPGFGAILTYKQSWTTLGITLGSLIKSIALAPGENTKVAVIDWQRTTSGTTSEDIAQDENLSNSQTQTRAISEIARATASELQSGSSLTGSTSASVNSGVGGGALIGGALVGASLSASINATQAATVTSSAGQRNVSSNMQQNINNSTHQNSFASRNKRASIVTEVSQSETETISTRTITNYNHMHALTIQYWQVVQAFTTEVKLDRYKRCVFIPMDIINFNDEVIINRFKSVLFASARTNYIKEMLSYLDNFVRVSFLTPPLSGFVDIPNVGEATAGEIRAAKITAAKMNAEEARQQRSAQDKGVIFEYGRREWKMQGSMALKNIIWRPGSDLIINKIIINLENGDKVELERNGTEAVLNMNEPIFISLIDSISLELNANPNKHKPYISFFFTKPAEPDKELSLSFLIPANQTLIPLLNFEAPIATASLGNLLNEDALYYSQQIWMNMDPNFLSMQLSPYRISVGNDKNKKTLNLTEYIDPKPIAVMGNCLAFIWHDQEDNAWIKWKEENINEDEITSQIIALPTDGVFGEAVLGRFNSAEKLDMTRFWNWQDSPIPFSAPDIAAIQAGNHNVEGPQRPGNLDTSLLSIQSPQTLPDPTGMQGVLQTLAVANLFRDMSGVAQTSLLAQGALNASSAGATAAGAQAGANMATFANFQVEMAKIAASLAPMLLNLPPSPVPATNNISNSGAALNAAKAVDANQIERGGSQGSSTPTQIQGGTTPRSSNEQKVLERVTGTTPSPTVMIPSPLNTSPGNERDTIVEQFRNSETRVPVPTTVDGVRDILNRAATSESGAPTDEELKAIEGFFKNDFEETIKPNILQNKDSFNQLSPVLRPFINWLSNIQLLGLNKEMQKEIEEGHEIVKNALLQSLNTAISETIRGNSLEQLSVTLDIISNAQLLGYGDSNSNFSLNKLFTDLELIFEIDTIFESNIINGEQRRLTITVTLNISSNEGIPLQNCPLNINVTGGTVSPFNSGRTNSVGEFVCSITCNDRDNLKISVSAEDSLGLGLSNVTEVDL